MSHKKDDSIAWVKEIITDRYGVIIAACDKELLGKTLKFGEIEINVSERFYGGKLVNEEELMVLLEEADVLNLIGNKVIEVAERLGLIHPEAKIFFEDSAGRKIPHSMMQKFQAFY